MKINISILFLGVVLITSSCVSQRDVTYFQSKNQTTEVEQIDIQEKYVAKLQVGDILGIMVSSLSPEASAMFNPYQNTQMIGATQTTQSNAPLPATGYLVDEAGFISLPFVGKLKLSGLSTKEAADTITKKLDQYLVQPTVNVRILNFKISILGEVARPSVYTIANEKITLPEALSLAGDLTIFGKRNNILIIRETNGKREFARVDLTQRDFFSSPYYDLHANDVVYVEPGKGRLVSTDRTLQLAPMIISALTLVSIILINILR